MGRLGRARAIGSGAGTQLGRKVRLDPKPRASEQQQQKGSFQADSFVFTLAGQVVYSSVQQPQMGWVRATDGGRDARPKGG